MAVARARILAVLFTGTLLLGAVLPALPTAAADPPTMTNVTAEAFYRGTPTRIQPTDLLMNGTLIEIRVSATITPRCLITTENATVTATAKMAGVFAKADPAPVTLAGPDANRVWTGTILAVIETTSPGVENSQGIPVDFEAVCPTTSGTEKDPDSVFTQNLNVDTKRPTLALGTPIITPGPNQVTLPVGKHLGVGSVVSITPTSVDQAVRLVIDDSAIDTNDPPVAPPERPSNFFAPHVKTIHAHDAPGMRQRDNANAEVIFKAIDARGNQNWQYVAFNIDNVPPATALSGVKVSPLLRTPSSVQATLTWTSLDTQARVLAGSQVLGTGGLVAKGLAVPVTGVDYLTTDLDFSVLPIDDAGNYNPSVKTDVTAPELANVNFGPGGIPVSIARHAFGTLTFTIPEGVPTGATAHENLYLRLQRVGTGEGFGYLINDTKGNANSHFTTDETKQINFRQAHGRAPGDAIFTNFTNAELLRGPYILHVAVNAPGVDLRQQIHFNVDDTPPQIATLVVGDADVVHGLDGNRLKLDLTVREKTMVGSTTSDSGIQNVTIQLLDAAVPGKVAKLANGKDASVDVTLASCPGNFTTCAADEFVGTAMSVWFPGLPVGEYKVRVLATDKVGLFAFDEDETIFKVMPRVGLDPSVTPFYGSNVLTVSALASHDVFQPGAGDRCAASAPTACQPATVEFFLRNDGSTGEGVKVRTLTAVPNRQFVTELTVPGANQSWPLFRFQETFDLTGVTGVNPTQPMEVRAKALVPRVGADAAEATTAWVDVETPTTPQLNVTLPLGVNWAGRWIVNTTGDVNIRADYDLRVEGVPTMYYVLNRTVPTQPADSPIKGPSQFFPAYREGPVARVDGEDTVHVFAGDLTGLPEGEYHLRILVYQGNVLKSSADRWFAVSTQSPTMWFNKQQAGVNMTVQSGLGTASATLHVGRSFDVAIGVDHGLLNVTGIPNFSYSLTRSSIAGSQAAKLTPGQEGFTVSVKNHSGFDVGKRRTYLNLTVTLPNDAKDGQFFTFDANVTAEARFVDGTEEAWQPHPSKYVAAASATLLHDRNPPSGDVFRAATNATGDSGGIAIRGFADDAGSGVKKVEVRVVDVTNGRTLLWGQDTAYAPGWLDAPEAWASSDVVPLGAAYARHVVVTKVSPTRWEWTVSATDRPRLDKDGNAAGGEYADIAFDRTTLYEVNVRVLDNLNQASVTTNTTVRFDGLPPVVNPSPFPHGILFNGGGLARVDWHGFPNDAEIRVQVRDNNCVKRVSIRGFDPDGLPVGPVDLRPTSAALSACSPAADKSVFHLWLAKMSELPALSDKVGRYKYYVEAEDAAGHNVSMPFDDDSTLKVDVVDSHKPVVRYVNLEPPLVGVGTSSRVVAEVFENGAISKVEVHVGRIGSGGAVTPLVVGAMRADPAAGANKSVRYVAETFADLNLTLETGDYLVQVRANDTANTCAMPTCPFTNTILRVSTDAPPAIVPLRSGGYVGAQAALTFEVTDRSVAQAGIRVLAGDSEENLTQVNATQLSLVPKAGPGGARIGWNVTYTPSALSGNKLFVRILASGNLSSEKTVNYTVDVAPPTANHTVTGLLGAGGREFAGPNTRVTLVYADANGSGVASATYTINGVGPTPYTGPITPQGTEGTWTLEYVVTDNATNVARGQVALSLDRKGPSLAVSRHGDDPLLLVSEPTSGSGIDEGNVTVHFAYNGSSTFTSKRMEKSPGTANMFAAGLGGNASEDGLRYWFEARDRLGNVGTLYNATSPFVVPRDHPVEEDLPPTLRITAPQPAAPVRDRVELKWTASDPEDKPVKVTIGLIEPGNPAGRFLVVDGDNSGSYVLNLAGLAAGSYTFTLVATDGVRTSATETRSFIVEAGSTVRTIALPDRIVQPNTATSFAVEIQPAGRNVTRATFSVTRDGQFHSNGTMQPQQGRYVGRVTPDEPGKYKIEVRVAYDQGSPEGPIEIASFEVPAPEEDAGMPVAFLVLLPIALLTVALAAWGAFGRWR